MKILEYFIGCTPFATLAWVLVSCFEIGFYSFASNWNFIKIMLEIFP